MVLLHKYLNMIKMFTGCGIEGGTTDIGGSKAVKPEQMLNRVYLLTAHKKRKPFAGTAFTYIELMINF